MANTYTLISSNVLSGSAASVTFSSIPSTYTDLVLRVSAREDTVGSYQKGLKTVVNSITSGYSNTYLYGDSAAAASGQFSNLGYSYTQFVINGGATTSNTFSSIELYIPNYAGSVNKPFSAFGAIENNSSTQNQAFVTPSAQLLSNTAAISSLTLSVVGGSNFVSGSSFYLYGIKNS